MLHGNLSVKDFVGIHDGVCNFICQGGRKSFMCSQHKIEGKSLLFQMNETHIKNPKSEITYFHRPHRKSVKETIIEKFAGPYDRGEFSPSVQKTLYETQVLVLDRVLEVSRHFRTQGLYRSSR